MSKHTPGPWEIGNAANCAKDHAVTAGAFVVARVVESRGEHINGNTRTPFDYGSANARLIAAAPDLLAALETARVVVAFEADARGDVDGDYDQPASRALEEIDAAIAKARTLSASGQKSGEAE
jgi:hypothetical protein